MLIWTSSTILLLITIQVASNHPLQDDSDPEIVEARRTQVLSGSTQHYFHKEDNDEDETEIERDGTNGGRRLSSRGQTRAKNSNKSNMQDRKGVVEKEEEDDNEENRGKLLSAEENNSKNRSKYGRSKPDEDQLDEEEKQSSVSPTKNASIESKSNKTINDTKDKKDETNLQVSPLSSESSSSQSFNSQTKQKTANDSHKNYTRLEPIRGRKSLSLTSPGSVGLTSTTPSTQFRRQRTPSHIQFDITSEVPDILLESVQNPKKRRRILTTSSSTTATPQTMPYNLYNHFRPLEQDVPQDHLLPFLDFGKKLSPGIPPTPSGINSIENKSVNQRYRSKENVTPEYRSSALDEDVLLHEDMDVTIQKKAIERNNIPRVKIQQIRDPYISGYYRRRPTTTAQPTQSTTSKTSENTIITTTDCSSVSTKDDKNDSEGSKTNSDSGKSGTSLHYKHNSRTITNNRTKCEYVDDSVSSTTTKYNKQLLQDNTQINEKLLSRNISNYRSGSIFNSSKILDVENIKTNSSNTRSQKFERMKMEPSSSVAPSLETTTISISNATKRILPVKLYLRNRNMTTLSKNDTAFTPKNNEEIKSTVDPLMHEESNTYEKPTNSSSQEPTKKQQIITTISPSNQQLTTRILSTAVVTSVSVKESLNENDKMNLKDNGTTIDSDSLLIAKNITSEKNKNEPAKLLKSANQGDLSDNKNISLINDGKSLNESSHFSDSTISDSSHKITMKPTEITIFNNRTVPEDFIEVPRIFTKNPRTTTVPTISTENNNRKEFNKTLITNPIYKPKIILPRTKVIVSSTPRATTLIPPTKMTRIPSIKARFDEKFLSKGTSSPIQFTPTKFLPRSSIYTKDITTSLPTINLSNITNTLNVTEKTPTAPVVFNVKTNNDEVENKNTAITSIPGDIIYNVKNDNSATNMTSDDEAKLIGKEDKINEKEEEVILNEKRANVGSSRKGNVNFHDDSSMNEKNENINQDDKNDSITPKIELSRENDKNNEEHYQSDDNHDNVPEENDQELSVMHEIFFTSTPTSTLMVPDKILQNTTTTIGRRVTTYSTTLPPLLTSSVSALDHKWLHSTGLRSNHNLSITDGQHTDVGVAYPQGVHIATYVFTGLGIIPILLLAVIVARVFIIRNRKKVLDESEYSSEYNRSPLGTTNSPLPTKLPRVPAHLGWEVEKSPPLPPIPVTSTRWEFPRDKLRLQTVLGQGNFGQVWKAEADDISGHEGLTRLVAVKTVKEGASNREREDLLRELGIMQELGAHPNVVTLLGCCTEKEPYLLIMEYVMYGKLLAFLRDHRTRAHYYNFSESTDALTSRDLTVFAYCVARGMDYLTTKGIIHRDIAARNVLVDHNKLCKIADFGMSRNVRDTGQIYEQRQSKGALPIRWMAPESLHFSLFTHKTDVWSFGILMWEIVTLGSTPYANMGAREVMRRVREGYRLDRPAHCHQEFFRVIQRCWHSEPAKRPTFAELKHELGQLLSDSEHGGGYVDLDGLAEEIKHHNHSGASTLQRPHNH